MSTKNVSITVEIDLALAEYVSTIQKMQDKWYQQFLEIDSATIKLALAPPAVYSEINKKYARIVIETGPYDRRVRKAHSFADLTTGNIYRATSWSSPNIRGLSPVRGNIKNLEAGGFDVVGVLSRHRGSPPSTYNTPV